MAKKKKSKKKVIRRASLRPGAAPGSLDVEPGALKPTIHRIEYDAEHLHESHDVAPHAVHPPASGGSRVEWVDVVGLGDADVLRLLGKRFALHPLALEDVVHPQERPKVEVYGDRVFAVIRIPHTERALEYEQISIFLGPQFVVTFQEQAGDCFEPVRERLRAGRGRVRTLGADYLAYALVDSAIDHYFPILSHFGDRLEALEEDILDSDDQNIVYELTHMRRELAQLSRAARPLREAVLVLSAETTPIVTDDTRIYLRDCLDHASQIGDLVENHRSHASSLVDLQLNMSSQRMNEIMKVLTVVTAVFIPLSFLVGLYGMNFDTSSPYNMPELGWRFGYPAIWALMIGISVMSFSFFWRRGWIGPGRRTRSRKSTSPQRVPD